MESADISPLKFDPGNAENGLGSVSSHSESSRFFVRALKTYSAEFGSESKYLALAAGEGGTESDIASNMGIEPSNMTAVDMNPKISNPEINVVKSDIVDYLKDAATRQERYDLVSALGIDYLLRKSGSHEELLKLCSQVLKPKGWLVFTEAGEHEIPQQLAASFGFNRKTRGVYQYNQLVQ